MTPRLLLAALLVASAPVLHAQVPAKPVDDGEFGLAKGSVFDTSTPKPYGFEGPGAGKVIPPPPGTPTMIPHAIDQYLPLQLDRNACLGCHDRPADIGRKVAKGAAHPAPGTHYATRDGKATLNGAMFNCTSCHAPQAGVAPLVGNAASPTR
jgi:hypothetical protein